MLVIKASVITKRKHNLRYMANKQCQQYFLEQIRLKCNNKHCYLLVLS